MINVPSESYITIEQADKYFSIRPQKDEWMLFSEEEKEQKLVSASDYLDDNYPLKNNLNAKMREGKEEVPPQVMRAVCEIAVNPNLNVEFEDAMTSVKVSSIEVKYDLNQSAYDASFANIENILRGLLDGNQNYIPIYRA